MKAKGFLNICKNNCQHNDSKICSECGAIFCTNKECEKWQEISFSLQHDMKLPKSKCWSCIEGTCPLKRIINHRNVIIYLLLNNL